MFQPASVHEEILDMTDLVVGRVNMVPGGSRYAAEMRVILIWAEHRRGPGHAD